MRSWRKEIMALLISILVVVLAFLFWVISFFNAEFDRRLQAQNETDLALWKSMTEGRLNPVHNDVYELLLLIYNNSTVAHGSGSLPLSVRVKCQRFMENQLIINSDAQCLFLMDADTDWRIFSAPTWLDSSQVSRLKKFVMELEPADAGSIRDKSWTLCTVGGSTYFLKFLQMGKYAAGALCQADTFGSVGDVEFFSQDKSLLLLSEGRLLYGGGGSNWADSLLPGEAEEPRFGDDRWVITSDFPLLHCSALLVSQRVSLAESSDRGVALSFVGAILLFFFLLILVTLLIFHRVVAPTKELLKAQEEIGSGNLEYRITAKPGSSEFGQLFDSFNSMAGQIRSLRIEAYDRLLREQEDKFRMVRAQIRPHFFLNAITVMSNMTYQNRLEDIRTYIQALAKHIRYMLNIQSSFVTVAEELGQVDNYFRMQELRFPGSVSATLECDEAVKEVSIPFLALFTVVENSFKHALNLYKPMEMRILCESYREEGFTGCRLVVEDNGDGYPDEVLDSFLDAPVDSLPTKDHLGLSNVRYTLRYLYGRDDLLRLSNLEPGARTEILIPTEVQDP